MRDSDRSIGEPWHQLLKERFYGPRKAGITHDLNCCRHVCPRHSLNCDFAHRRYLRSLWSALVMCVHRFPRDASLRASRPSPSPPRPRAPSYADVRGLRTPDLTISAKLAKMTDAPRFPGGFPVSPGSRGL